MATNFRESHRRSILRAEKTTKLKSKAVWGATPAGSLFAGGAAPGTKEFFENVLKKRSGHEMPWLFDLVPFASFRGKKVLEIGCGAGYDAYEFCRNGADYTGIDITPENIERTKEHLGYYAFSPDVREADAEALPFSDGTFDMVYSNGVLHHTPDMGRSFREAHRVLKAGGEFRVILYHKHSVFYWGTLFLVDHVLKLGFLRRRFKERLSMIEYTTSKELPIVNAYSRADLKKRLAAAGFAVESVWVRKLVKEDLPALPLIGRLWNYIPQPWLDAAGRRFGWYAIAKAIKE